MLSVTVREGKILTTIFLIVVGSGLSTALYLYFIVDKYSLLYYWDAVSHLVAARKLVDWGENPGFGQIGTVWMPLPHFLLLPFAIIDPLFTTGFAGLAVSLPALALTSIYLYKIVRGFGISNIVAVPAYAAFVGALLYASNPNILYLGITSMTEAPFVLFFVAAAYYFQSWYQNTGKLRNLLLCSIFLSFATLCRYESWFLPLFLIIVASASVARDKYPNTNKILVILVSLLSLSSITFWLAWNQYHYGDPFEFSNTEYYSASWYAQNRPFRELLFLQPMNVLSVYGITALMMYGPYLLVAAAIGYHTLRKAHIRREKIILLFLALPPLFTLISLLIGIGEMSLWFNSRFMILLSPLIILMTCIFLAKRYGSARKWQLAAVIGGLFIWQLAMPAFSAVITLADAKGGYSVKENLLAIETGEALKSLYDDGKIMILTGSGLEQRVMITSGIALSNFDEIISHSTWKASFREPWLYDKWLIITSRPGSDAIDTTTYWLDRMDELESRYKTVYENEYYKIMVLR